ncbi:MAG: GNAT family N-acetyltransferase [bacterium]|nr:GNAT family N-acetyltransferase [bacterium]
MDSTPSPTRHALERDLPQLADTLLSAFSEDPVMMWLFADPETRGENLRRWMHFNLQLGLTKGHVYSAGDNGAAAIWSPPDVAIFDEFWGPRMAKLTVELVGAERAPEALGGLGRALQVQKREEPHFYLFVLGAHAEVRGRGLGGEAIAPVLETCDREGLPAYLESSTARNHGFYFRHGFEITHELKVADDGPRIWPMRRAPRS